MANARKGQSLNNIILFLIYVALALTVVWLRPTIAEKTGLSQNSILGIAIVIFLAIAIGSAVMRRKKSHTSGSRE
jgi:LPXTG-motif cell wall-anchored protein